MTSRMAMGRGTMEPSFAMKQLLAAAALGGLFVAAGCTQSSNLNQGGTLPSQQAAPLPPTPSQPVQQGALPPPPDSQANSQTQVAAVEPLDTQPQDGLPDAPEPVTAAPQPPTNAQPVTRQAMVGAWTVSTGGSNCQIFLALTKWSGGYRAASRGCSAAAISDVQAWDVKGKQVVLVDSSGSTAATLFRSGETRYDGSTTSGGAISFVR